MTRPVNHVPAIQLFVLSSVDCEATVGLEFIVLQVRMWWSFICGHCVAGIAGHAGFRWCAFMIMDLVSVGSHGMHTHCISLQLIMRCATLLDEGYCICSDRKFWLSQAVQ